MSLKARTIQWCEGKILAELTKRQEITTYLALLVIVLRNVSSVNYNFPSTTIISSLQLSYPSHELMFPGGAPHGGQDFGCYVSLFFLFLACSAR